MGADEVAAIRPAILEVQVAAAGGEGKYFATFECEDRPSVWVQVTSNCVNFAKAERIADSDPVEFTELVCRTADLADDSSSDSAEIWAMVADLDIDNDLIQEVVDHARQTLKDLGIPGPPTFDDEFEDYDRNRPATEGIMAKAKIAFARSMSNIPLPDKIKHANEALRLLDEYEQIELLSKKQHKMRQAMLALTKCSCPIFRKGKSFPSQIKQLHH